MSKCKLGITRPLTRAEVNKIESGKCGNYALGTFRIRRGSTLKIFEEKYIGRSDSCLKSEILQQAFAVKIKSDGTPKYTHFKYSTIANTAIKAFKKECENYHDCKDTIENIIHPAIPKNTDSKKVKCPVKDCKG